MKYKAKKQVKYTYSVAELIGSDNLQKLCTTFGLTPQKILNKAKSDKEVITFAKIKKIMEEIPRGKIY